MNRPQPGLYLFVGGPADGERRTIDEPREYFTVVKFEGEEPSLVNGWNADAPKQVPFNQCVYRLECLREGDITVWCYVHQQKYKIVLVETLLNGYRRAK